MSNPVDKFLKKETTPTKLTTLSRIKFVRKRDGFIEPFNEEKLRGWAEWAGANSPGTDWELVIKNALRSQARDYITTDDLQQLLINSAEALIRNQPAYDVMAKNLLLAKLRKNVYDSFEPPSLRGWYNELVSVGAWQCMPWITEESWNKLEAAIDHSRDLNFTYAGLKQFQDKYSRRNEVTSELYETPQFMYMGMAMSMLQMDYWTVEEAISLYDKFSLFKANVPTPPLVGLRSSDRGFASCCLIEAKDTLDSIGAANDVVFKMVAARAGIGFALRTRALGDPIRNGAFSSTGKLPYLRLALANTQANTQQTRGGSMTANIPFFDPEIREVMASKSQRSAADARIDKSDFVVQFNRLLLERAIKGENITLMSVYYAPEVFEAFYHQDGDESHFIKVYEAAEKRLKDLTRPAKGNTQIPIAQTVKALELLELAISVRMETGRLYFQNIAETNRHSNYNEPIKMTNLCVEINEPTYPINHVTDLYKTRDQLIGTAPGDNGEIALCNLGAVILGNVVSQEDWEETTYLLLKFVDTILEIQDYAYPAMEFTAKARRNVGIGVMNAAGAMAALGIQFEGIEARNWMHTQMENHAYYLHKASVRLAKELGAAEWFKYTKPASGVLVIDTYNKNVDELVTVGLQHDWESLRADILKYGMRNSVLSAQMPGESSSVTTGTTNSINPIRNLVVVKGSGVNKTIFVAPHATTPEAKNYIPAFELDHYEWIKFVGVTQKFLNQAISADMFYCFDNYPDGKIPNTELIKHLLTAVRYGWKSWYYAWFDSFNGGAVHQAETETTCESGACTL